MENQYLPIAIRTSADADGWNLDLLGDQRGHFARDAFQHHAASPATLQRERVMHKLLDSFQRLALHLVAAHGVEGLRRQSDVSHHGNLSVDQSEEHTSELQSLR